MKIHVFGHVSQLISAKSMDVDWRAGMTVADILAELRINPLLIAAVLANGQRVASDYMPAIDDELTLMSPMAGGSE